ncbi:MAG: methyltransferase domain-containing protein [Planctomycetota bacterium]|jgi:hypothetical protein
MEERFQRETRALVQSWMRHDRDELRDYLVDDVEDPRINVPSVLMRHSLIEDIFGERFAALREHELRFAAAMNWLLRTARAPGGEETLRAALDSLLEVGDEELGEDVGAAADDGAPRGAAPGVPAFVAETFAMLPCEAEGVEVPDYLTDALIARPEAADRPVLEEPVLSTFEPLWRTALAREPGRRVPTLEMACGSANDYRFFGAFGIARFLDYVGVDLCEKNVLNAREMFPDVPFRVGNAMAIDARDRDFDLCIVQDLLEHLSLEAMERAVAELCRVTRRRLCVGFFNMYDRDEHTVRPVDDYYCNELSLGRTREAFERQGFAVEAVRVGDLLASRFGCGETHNDGACTFIMERRPAGAPAKSGEAKEAKEAKGAEEAERRGVATGAASSAAAAPSGRVDSDVAAADYLEYHAGRSFASDRHRILLACLPKSGSTYLARMLSLRPGWSKAPLVTGYGRREQELSVERLLAAHRAYGNYVAQHHVRYSDVTRRLMERFVLKPVVLVRNIFDAAVSVRDHLLDELPAISQAYVPADIAGWDEERQFHFIADMVMPWYFNFFASWADCPDKLLVAYEEMHADAFAVVRRIADHYGLGVADGEIRAAVEEAGGSGEATRKNKGVLGRGDGLPDDVKRKIADLARYYEGVDFSIIGL